MNRRNHYEAAFEAFLRDRRMPYVAVDESKKALFSGAKLKSFDFVVYSRTGPNLLVDVKGRKAMNDSGSLQTWATRRDVDDLHQWERIFGDDFRAVFAFVFEIQPILAPPPGHFSIGDDEAMGTSRHYLMYGVGIGEYRNHMTRRSEKWETVSIPVRDFTNIRRPMEAWL